MINRSPTNCEACASDISSRVSLLITAIGHGNCLFIRVHYKQCILLFVIFDFEMIRINIHSWYPSVKELHT